MLNFQGEFAHVDFNKISQSPVEFSRDLGSLKFVGSLSKKGANLVSCIGKLNGELKHTCDRCGEDITLKLNEKLDLILSSGVYSSGDFELDVMEFFEGFIDLDEILQSEVEAYKSDYHYCEICKTK